MAPPRIQKGGSCLCCRLHKLKCNEEMPCSTCVRRKTEDQCRKNPPRKWISQVSSTHLLSMRKSIHTSSWDWESFGRLSTQKHTVQERTSQNSLVSLFQLNSCLQKSASWRLHLTRLLPYRVHCDLMVDLYFKDCLSVFRSLHEPSFRVMYQRLWQTPVSEISLTDLASVLSVICVVSQNATKRLCDEMQLKPRLLRNYSAVWFVACQQSLKAQDADKSPFIEQISVFVTLVPYLVCTHRVNELKAYLGETIAASSMIGLHQETASKDCLEQEQRRRLWWNLCATDTMIALNRSEPPIISCGYSDYTFPSYCRDEDITPDSVTHRDLTTEPLSIAANYYFIRICKVVNRMWTPDGEFLSSVEVIDGIDREIGRIVSTFPWFLSPVQPTLPVPLRSPMYWASFLIWTCVHFLRVKVCSFLPTVDGRCLAAAHDILTPYRILSDFLPGYRTDAKFLRHSHLMAQASVTKASFALVSGAGHDAETVAELERVHRDLVSVLRTNEIEAEAIVETAGVLGRLIMLIKCASLDEGVWCLHEAPAHEGDAIRRTFGGEQIVREILGAFTSETPTGGLQRWPDLRWLALAC